MHLYENFYDVVVVGGGIAGVSAALAASRAGADVLLIEKETFPGGLATLGNVIVYLPLCDGAGNQVSAGIAEELLRLSVRDGFCKIPSCWEKDGSAEERKKIRFRVDFNPASFMLDLEELLLQNKVKILYDSRFYSVEMNGNRISSIYILNKSGMNKISCNFVVDATGDADVFYAAGERTENLSTNVECSWFFHIEEDLYGKIDNNLGQNANEERPSFKGRNFKLSVNSVSKPFNPDPTKLPEGVKGYSGTDGWSVSEFIIASHQLIRNKLNDIRNKNSDKKIYPAILPTIATFRSTRRFAGEFELTGSDEFKKFHDVVGIVGNWRKNASVYQIPYRALRADKTENLISAGRIISASGVAWDVTRVIPACAVTGEAAGTAAALASKNSCRNLKDLDIKLLQNTLAARGVILDQKA